MRVGIDLFALVPSVGRGAGFHRYVHGLVSALNELEDDHTYYVFLNRLNASMCPTNGRFICKVVPLPPQRELWPFRLLWQNVILPILARRYRLDLVHFPMDTASFTLRRPYVVTINDLIADVYYPQHFPQSESALKARYLFRNKRHAAQGARAVLCPSRTTADLVCRHYGISPKKVAVVPYAADRAFFRNGAPEGQVAKGGGPYILSVVSLSPHKNITTLVEAFARARERFRLPHHLKIVGMRGMDPEPIERFLAEQRRRGIPVHYLGFIEDDALREAYAGADLFVYLSLAEGFGLPPLEAMASGVPVVASNVSSLPEVCADGARLVDPTDAAAIATTIGDLLTTPAMAEGLTSAGKRRAEHFSWSKTARRTVAVYEAAARR